MRAAAAMLTAALISDLVHMMCSIYVNRRSSGGKLSYMWFLVAHK